jgi:hypothetical protein
MNELVTVTESGGRPGVNARDLHGRLGVGRDFSTWIKDRIEKYELVEGKDYETCSPNLVSRFVEEKDYQKSQSPNLGSEISDLDSPNLANQDLVGQKKWGGAGMNRIDYILSIQAAMLIASGENSPVGVAIAKSLSNQAGQIIENHVRAIKDQAGAMESMADAIHRQDQIITKQGEALQDLRLLGKKHDDFEDSVKEHIHYLEEGYKKMSEERRFENQRVLDRFMAAELDMTGGRTLVLDAYRIYVEKYDGKLSLREFGLDVPFRKTFICLVHTKDGVFWTGCRLRRGK